MGSGWRRRSKKKTHKYRISRGNACDVICAFKFTPSRHSIWFTYFFCFWLGLFVDRSWLKVKTKSQPIAQTSPWCVSFFLLPPPFHTCLNLQSRVQEETLVGSIGLDYHSVTNILYETNLLRHMHLNWKGKISKTTIPVIKNYTHTHTLIGRSCCIRSRLVQRKTLRWSI